MTQYTAMDTTFEKKKNLEACIYTAIVCAALAALLFLASLKLPAIVPPEIDEGIEVNLGTDETGLGTDQPLLPGDPAPQHDQASAPQPVANDPAAGENVQTDDNEPSDVAAVKKSEEVKTEVKKPIEKADTRPTAKMPEAKTTPTPAKPKAVFTGKTSANAKGTGGNGSADSYYKGGNQGIAGGDGDQGRPGGNPNSDSYTGNSNSGTSGVKIRSGLDGRRISKLPSFEDDFNENATVMVRVIVNKTGTVINASISLSGTTTINNTIRNIALRKAGQLKFNPGNEDEQVGIIAFTFRVKG